MKSLFVFFFFSLFLFYNLFLFENQRQKKKNITKHNFF